MDSYRKIVEGNIITDDEITEHPERLVSLSCLRPGTISVIFETRSHVGGRSDTLREPFAEGLYAEAGAMRLPRAHDLTMAYIVKYSDLLPIYADVQLPTILDALQYGCSKRPPTRKPRAYGFLPFAGLF